MAVRTVSLALSLVRLRCALILDKRGAAPAVTGESLDREVIPCFVPGRPSSESLKGCHAQLNPDAIAVVGGAGGGGRCSGWLRSGTSRQQGRDELAGGEASQRRASVAIAAQTEPQGARITVRTAENWAKLAANTNLWTRLSGRLRRRVKGFVAATTWQRLHVTHLLGVPRTAHHVESVLLSRR